MVSGEAHTIISVRGEASRIVAPDQASLVSTVAQLADSKSAATEAVAASLRTFVAELADLGGRPLTVESTRAALTWSTRSIETNEEYGEKRGGAHGPTGRHQAVCRVVVGVRDFAVLDAVSAVVTSRDERGLQFVAWSVDDDNGEWARVRADAIQAALRKGQDYAVALGGSIVRVEHVADAGLLGGAETSSGWTPHRANAMSASVGGGESAGVSLDPVPQELRAVIEARLSAVVGPVEP